MTFPKTTSNRSVWNNSNYLRLYAPSSSNSNDASDKNKPVKELWSDDISITTSRLKSTFNSSNRNNVKIWRQWMKQWPVKLYNEYIFSISSTASSNYALTDLKFEREKINFLQLAAHNKCVAAIRAFISESGRRGNINAYSTGHGRTPLMICAENNFLDGVKTLVEEGANLSLYDRYGWNVLHLTDNLEIISYLLDKNRIYVDVRGGKDDWTALHLAAFKGKPNLCKLFISFGSDINSISKPSGATPLHYAAHEGHLDVVKELIINHNAKCDILVQPGDCSPLSWAVMKGNENVVSCLLDVCNIVIDSHQAFDLLQFIIINNYSNIFRIMLKYGYFKNINNIKSKKGQTCLHIAAEFGRIMFCRELISMGIDVDVRENVHGWTPLMLAVQNNHLDCFRELLKLGAEPFNKDIFGDNLLILSVRSESIDVVKYILNSAGSVKLLKKKDGLEVRGWKKNSALMVGIQIDSLEITKLLIEKGAKLNGKNDFGETPLILASKNRNIEIIKNLLESGKIQVNEKNKEGRTALDFAFEKRDNNICRMLLQNGAKINKNAKSNLDTVSEKESTLIPNKGKSIATFCYVCNNQTSQKCSRCGLVYYCTVWCQKKDIKNHKKICKPKKIK